MTISATRAQLGHDWIRQLNRHALNRPRKTRMGGGGGILKNKGIAVLVKLSCLSKYGTIYRKASKKSAKICVQNKIYCIHWKIKKINRDFPLMNISLLTLPFKSGCIVMDDLHKKNVKLSFLLEVVPTWNSLSPYGELPVRRKLPLETALDGSTLKQISRESHPLAVTPL